MAQRTKSPGEPLVALMQPTDGSADLVWIITPRALIRWGKRVCPPNKRAQRMTWESAHLYIARHLFPFAFEVWPASKVMSAQSQFNSAIREQAHDLAADREAADVGHI